MTKNSTDLSNYYLKRVLSDEIFEKYTGSNKYEYLIRSLKTFLKTPIVTFGRDDKSSIRLHHIEISRNHAKIYAENDKFIFEDVNNTNGSTLVKRSKTIELLNSKHELEPGDVIIFAPKVVDAHNFRYKFLKIQDEIIKYSMSAHVPVSSVKTDLKRKFSNALTRDSSIKSQSNTSQTSIQSDKKFKPSESPEISQANLQKEQPSSLKFCKDIEQEFMCQICLEMVIPPLTSLGCGHNFCVFCIEKWSFRKLEVKFKKDAIIETEILDTCPSCAGKISFKQDRNYAFENVVNKLEENLSPEDKLDRQEAKKERLLEIENFEILKEKFNLKNGTKVDIQTEKSREEKEEKSKETFVEKKSERRLRGRPRKISENKPKATNVKSKKKSVADKNSENTPKSSTVKTKSRKKSVGTPITEFQELRVTTRRRSRMTKN